MAPLGQEFLLHAENEYLVVPSDIQVVEQARILIGRHVLRALDAIQLASAGQAKTILGEPVTFISSDRNLLAAVAAEGKPTDDPLN